MSQYQNRLPKARSQTHICVTPVGRKPTNALNFETLPCLFIVSAVSRAFEMSQHNLILAVKGTEADTALIIHCVTTQLQLWILEERKRNP